MLNIPEVWRYHDTAERILVEPHIEGFQKFNSNSGWVADPGSFSTDAMQTLSHFSYHHSQRKYILCDIQGDAFPSR